MSRSFRKYPIYKRSRGNKGWRMFANRIVRNSKEVKNGGMYKKFQYIEKYKYGCYAKTLQEHLEFYDDVPLDKAYKYWICHYYTK